jgi:hypothetical protein
LFLVVGNIENFGQTKLFSSDLLIRYGVIGQQEAETNRDSLVKVGTTGESEHHEGRGFCAFEAELDIDGSTVLEPLFPEWIKVRGAVVLLWPFHT